VPRVATIAIADAENANRERLLSVRISRSPWRILKISGIKVPSNFS
jgi:hypothetical protein